MAKQANKAVKTTIQLERSTYERLHKLARRYKRPVSRIIQEMIASGISSNTTEDRLAAVEELCALELPVADWQVMEQQITEGALEP